jgi:membrane fusion protein (multidrug efflux system)
MQEIDERTPDLSNKKAAVNSGQANVERLEALAGYKKITLPFDGVVTARDTDVGTLINAGGGTGPAMFVVFRHQQAACLRQHHAELRARDQDRR